MIGNLVMIIMLMGVAFGGVSAKESKQPVVERTPFEFCGEVEHEIRIQMESGMLTQKDGERIINKCWRLFGPK